MSKHEFIKIVNWEKYQHYKHRKPKWVKLYGKILDDYDFCMLSDEAKLLFYTLLSLAAKFGNGEIPRDIRFIKNQASISIIKEKNLTELEAVGIIEICYQNASKMLASCKQSVQKTLCTLYTDNLLSDFSSNTPDIISHSSDPISSINTKKRKINCTTQKKILPIWNFYLEKIDKINSNGCYLKLPRPRSLTSKREKIINARLEEGYTQEELKTAISNVLSSRFHLGHNDRNQPYVDIEMIFNPNKIAKYIVLEATEPENNAILFKNDIKAIIEKDN